MQNISSLDSFSKYDQNDLFCPILTSDVIKVYIARYTHSINIKCAKLDR